MSEDEQTNIPSGRNSDLLPLDESFIQSSGAMRDDGAALDALAISAVDLHPSSLPTVDQGCSSPENVAQGSVPVRTSPLPFAYHVVDVDSQAGGYDSTDFVVPLEEKHRCGICLCGLRDAVQTPCGHRFCSGCIESLRGTCARAREENGAPLCPIDRMPITEVFPDNFCRREVMRLTVKCRANSSGCTWTGELQDLEAHSAVCLILPMCCPNSAHGCSAKLSRECMDQHLVLECAYRSVACSRCNVIVPLAFMDDHVKMSCGRTESTVKCVFCGALCEWRNLSDHLRVACPRAINWCDYSPFGCSFQGTREGLKHHNEAAQDYHLRIVTQRVNRASQVRHRKKTTKIKKKQLQEALSRLLEEQATSMESEQMDTSRSTSNQQLDSQSPFLLDISTSVGSQDTATWFAVNLLRGERVSGLDFLNSLQTMGGSMTWPNAVYNTLIAWIRTKPEEATGANLYSALISIRRRDVALRFRQELLNEPPAAASSDNDAFGNEHPPACGHKSGENIQKPVPVETAAGVSMQSAEGCPRDGSVNCEMMKCNNVIVKADDMVVDPDLQSHECTSYNGVLVWKILDYERLFHEAHTGKKLSIYSPPFFTSRYGYKLCARMYMNGDGSGKGTHMSLFFVVMKGQYDAILPWPFLRKVTLTLLDQSPSKRHISDTFMPDPSSSSFQRPISEMNIASGCPQFVSLDTLQHSTYNYIKDNTMFIHIVVDTSGLALY